jgi:natural product biosynthesis luciferase-like monooxygenase protein
MQFGLFYLPTSVTDDPQEAARRYREILDQVAYAEKLDFRSVWLAEHHFHPFGGMFSAPVAIGAAIAERCSRIRIGTAVALLPYHNPIRLAEDYATLDLLSQGRLDFGVGAGFVKAEALTFDVPLDEIRDRFREHLEIILAAWTQAEVSYAGTFHRYERLAVWPRPLQRPHPPVWLGVTATPESFQMAGRLGYHLMLIPFLHELEDLREKVMLYLEAFDKAGHDRARLRIGATYHIHVGETSERARKAGRFGVMEYIGSSGKAHALTPDIADPASYQAHTANRAVMRGLSFEDLVERGRVIVGDADQVRERARHVTQRLFVTDLVGDFALGGLSDVAVRASMQRFMERVAPSLG